MDNLTRNFAGEPIYHTSRYKTGVSLEEFEKATNKAIMDAENNIKCLDGTTDDFRDAICRQIKFMNQPYLRVTDDNKIVIDKNLANYDIMNYKIVNGIYKSQINMLDALDDANIEVSDSTQYNGPNFLDIISTPKASFKDSFDLYCELKETGASDEKCLLMELRVPLIKNAYNVLGKDEVRRLKYNVSNIRRTIIAKSPVTHGSKILALIQNQLPMQKAIPIEKVRQAIKKAYENLGIKASPKSTVLDN